LPLRWFMFALEDAQVTAPSAEEVSLFLQSRGIKVVRTESGCWYAEYQQARILQSFPPQRLLTPTAAELRDVFKQFPRAIAARYIGPMKGRGKASFRWVYRRPFDLAKLTHKVRNRTRSGLKMCQIRNLGFQELIPLADESHRNTMERHGEKTPTSLGLSRELDQCRAYEAWGAFVNERLAAFLVTLWVEDWAHIIIQRSANAYLKYYPNNALVVTVLENLLTRHGVSVVNYGWESLSPSESLDYFKASMGFEQEPIRQRIALRSWLRGLLHPVICRILIKGFTLRSRGTFLERIPGFLRILADS